MMSESEERTFIGIFRLDINTIGPKNPGKRPNNRGNAPNKYGNPPKIDGNQPKNRGKPCMVVMFTKLNVVMEFVIQSMFFLRS